jgi:predicted DNA-binding antitoxin AbrB/MazE fold protein
MSEIILATVEDGRFKPDIDMGLTSGTRVRLTVDACDAALSQSANACETLDALCEEFPVESHGNRLTRDQLHDRR